jgi:uncharacterized protein (DUF58 family)
MAHWRDLFDEAFLRRLEQLHVLARSGGETGGAGRRRSRRLGDGLEFADHRDYAPGDDTRFVDWPYFARMEKLLLRLFHEHSEADVVLGLDCSASMGAGPESPKFRWSMRAAAALGYIALASLDRVTIRPFARAPIAGRTFRGKERLTQMLAYLAELVPQGPTDLEGACRDLARQGPPRAGVLLISDLLECDDQLDRALSYLASARCDVSIIHVVDPEDRNPSMRGPLMLRASEEDATLSIEVTDAVAEAVSRRFDRFAEACRRRAVARGANYVPARTDRNIDELVVAALRKARVLGS